MGKQPCIQPAIFHAKSMLLLKWYWELVTKMYAGFWQCGLMAQIHSFGVERSPWIVLKANCTYRENFWRLFSFSAFSGLKFIEMCDGSLKKTKRAGFDGTVSMPLERNWNKNFALSDPKKSIGEGLSGMAAETKDGSNYILIHFSTLLNYASKKLTYLCYLIDTCVVRCYVYTQTQYSMIIRWILISHRKLIDLHD